MEAVKIYDRSPYGNSGKITRATWVRLPSGLWCLSFCGQDDYVDCRNHSSLDITTSITVEAWGRPGASEDTKLIAKDYNAPHAPFAL